MAEFDFSRAFIAGYGSAPGLPDTDWRGGEAARPDTTSPGPLIQRAYAHAGGFDHAGPEGRSRRRARVAFRSVSAGVQNRCLSRPDG